MLRALCLATATLVLPVGGAFAGAPGDLGANAALKYWQAFAMLPRLTDAEGKKLNAECPTMPRDAQARKLVSRAAYALRMMHRGAARPRCDWGIGYEEEGVATYLPHGDGARMLSALACLRARLRFEEGNSAEAIDDVVAALTLARQVSRDGVNILVLVGYHLEHRMIETLARHLPKLDVRTIRDLKTRLEALPPGGGPAAALAYEQKGALDWLVRNVKAAKDRDSLLAFLSQAYESPEKARAFLQKCGGTAKGVLRYAEEVRPWYALMARKVGLPLEQFVKEEEREAKKRSGNPVFRDFLPALAKMRWQQARIEVRRALLSAAFAVQQGGKGALKEHPDPVAGGPFEHVAFRGGFELRSKWKVDDSLRSKWKLDDRLSRPLVLTVGRRGPSEAEAATRPATSRPRSSSGRPATAR